MTAVRQKKLSSVISQGRILGKKEGKPIAEIAFESVALTQGSEGWGVSQIF